MSNIIFSGNFDVDTYITNDNTYGGESSANATGLQLVLQGVAAEPNTVSYPLLYKDLSSFPDLLQVNSGLLILENVGEGAAVDPQSDIRLYRSVTVWTTGATHLTSDGSTAWAGGDGNPGAADVNVYGTFVSAVGNKWTFDIGDIIADAIYNRNKQLYVMIKWGPSSSGENLNLFESLEGSIVPGFYLNYSPSELTNLPTNTDWQDGQNTDEGRFADATNPLTSATGPVDVMRINAKAVKNFGQVALNQKGATGDRVVEYNLNVNTTPTIINLQNKYRNRFKE